MPGSISRRYGHGSFYHQAKIVSKTLIPTVLSLLFDFLSFKNYENEPSKRKQQENLFSIDIFKINDENSRIRIRIHNSERAWKRGCGSVSVPKCHGSATLKSRNQLTRNEHVSMRQNRLRPGPSPQFTLQIKKPRNPELHRNH
jgi:hypothetical protein